MYFHLITNFILQISMGNTVFYGLKAVLLILAVL